MGTLEIEDIGSFRSPTLGSVGYNGEQMFIALGRENSTNYWISELRLHRLIVKARLGIILVQEMNSA